MAANSRFGWHSGTLKCRDAKIGRDLYVQDDIVFSDVSAGQLGVTGGIDMTGTTHAVGIDMNGGTFSTADLRLADGATLADSSSTLTITQTNITLAGAITFSGTFAITSTTNPQFYVKYDGSNYVSVGVSDVGAVKLAAVGSGDSFEIETGDGKIILDAKTDIDLDPEGNDINLLGSAAGKITLAAASVTVYGGDTSGDALVLQGNSADAGQKITITGASGTTITGNATMASTAALYFNDAGTYVYSSADGKLDLIADTGGIYLTVPGSATDGVQIGGNPDWGAGTAGPDLDGTGWDWAMSNIARVTTENATATAYAAQYNAFTLTKSQNLAGSCFTLWNELYLSASVDLTGFANVASVWAQVEAGAGVTGPDQSDGDFMTAGYFNFITGANFTTGSYVNGVRIQSEVSDSTYTLTGSTWMAGLEVLRKTGSYQNWTYGVKIANSDTGIDIGACATTGLNISGDAQIGISIASQTTAAIVFGASAGQIVDVAASVTIYGGDTTGDDLLLYANSADGEYINIQGGGSINIIGPNGIKLDGTVTLDDDGTIADASNEMTLTQDTITVAGATKINLDGSVDVTGIIVQDNAITSGTYYTVASGSTATLVGALKGISVDFDGITLSDQNCTGVEVLMPATYTAGTEYGVYVSGDGTTVALCSDDAEAITIGGTVTTGLSIGGTLTTGILLTGATGYAIDIVTSGQFRMGVQGTGIPTASSTPFAMEIHSETGEDLTAGGTGLTCGIRSRYEVSVAQTTMISFASIDARLRVKEDLGDGEHCGIRGTIEASESKVMSGTSTTQRNAGSFTLDFSSGSTITSGWLTGITIDSSVDGSISMASCTFVGARIKAGSGKEAFEHGIYLDADSAVTGITLGACTTGIAMTGTIGTGIDLSGATTTKDIVLENGEAINNSTSGYVDTDGAFRISGVGGAGAASTLTLAYLEQAAGSNTATFTNAPVSGNPTKYLAVYLGTTKYLVPLLASA